MRAHSMRTTRRRFLLGTGALAASVGLRATERGGAAGKLTEEGPSPSAAPDRVNGGARLAATLMRSAGGPEVAVVDVGGWDTRANQGGARERLRNGWQGSTGRCACWRMSWAPSGRKPRFSS